MSLLSRLGKGLVGAVGGFIGGGPAGALAGGIAGAFGGRAPKPARRQPQQRSLPSPRTLPGKRRRLPDLRSTGRAGARGLGAGAITGAVVSGVKGRRMVETVEGDLVEVKKARRMNPMNVQALNRAMRRVKAAEKIAAKVGKITGKSFRRPSRRARAHHHHPAAGG